MLYGPASATLWRIRGTWKSSRDRGDHRCWQYRKECSGHIPDQALKIKPYAPNRRSEIVRAKDDVLVRHATRPLGACCGPPRLRSMPGGRSCHGKLRITGRVVLDRGE